MDPRLHIESILAYYDAPICGVASLGDRTLYYNWVEDTRTVDGTMKIRCYCAWELSAEEWALIEMNVALETLSVLPDGEDADAAAMARADKAARRVGALHESLESREGVVGFTSSSLPFPSFC